MVPNAECLAQTFQGLGVPEPEDETYLAGAMLLLSILAGDRN